MNNSDNYVEYIERLLENINLEENEHSIQQALHIANQNFNLDDDQTQMLGNILQEITMQGAHKQDKSLSGHNVLQGLNPRKATEPKDIVILEQIKGPSVQPSQHEIAEKEDKKKQIKEIIKSKNSSSKLCVLF